MDEWTGRGRLGEWYELRMRARELPFASQGRGVLDAEWATTAQLNLDIAIDIDIDILAHWERRQNDIIQAELGRASRRIHDQKYQFFW